MKKILATLLAVGTALTMGVSAFALTDTDFACPNGNTECINNGVCINNGECQNREDCTGVPRRDGSGGGRHGNGGHGGGQGYRRNHHNA